MAAHCWVLRKHLYKGASDEQTLEFLRRDIGAAGFKLGNAQLQRSGIVGVGSYLLAVRGG